MLFEHSRNDAYEDGKEDGKAELRQGRCCCLCFVPFKAPHGFPVVCFKCWRGLDNLDADNYQCADEDQTG